MDWEIINIIATAFNEKVDWLIQYICFEKQDTRAI
jgi:hypothetical protein